MSDLPPRYRLPLLLAGMICLLAGLQAGLLRMGVAFPATPADAGAHGPLMIAAFFATVIGLERAVAVGRLWPYLAPLCSALGGIALLAGLAPARPLLVLGAALFLAASAVVLARQLALFTAILALGAAALLCGNLLWTFAGASADAAPFWMAFLVLTIAAERLELTRFLPTPPAARSLLIAIVFLLGLGAGGDLRLFGAALLALALWLLRFDIARSTVHQQGLPRYIAICLLSGYVWLALGGLLGATGAFAAGALWRDAALHAVFLGFVLAMVFGHAPIIVPAVMRVAVPYRPVLYGPLLLLHLSLLARVGAGLGGLPALQRAAGIANAVALLLFVVTLLSLIVRGRTAPPVLHPQPQGEIP